MLCICGLFDFWADEGAHCDILSHENRFLDNGQGILYNKVTKYPNEEVPEMVLFTEAKIPGRAARDLLT